MQNYSKNNICCVLCFFFFVASRKLLAEMRCRVPDSFIHLGSHERQYGVPIFQQIIFSRRGVKLTPTPCFSAKICDRVFVVLALRHRREITPGSTLPTNGKACKNFAALSPSIQPPSHNPNPGSSSSTFCGQCPPRCHLAVPRCPPCELTS